MTRLLLLTVVLAGPQGQAEPSCSVAIREEATIHYPDGSLTLNHSIPTDCKTGRPLRTVRMEHDGEIRECPVRDDGKPALSLCDVVATTRGRPVPIAGGNVTNADASIDGAPPQKGPQQPARFEAGPLTITGPTPAVEPISCTCAKLEDGVLLEPCLVNVSMVPGAQAQTTVRLGPFDMLPPPWWAWVLIGVLLGRALQEAATGLRRLWRG